MEFPQIGKQCALAECKKLDFLPIDCPLCCRVFCKDHVGYEHHSCTELYKKDKRIPVCPLCNQPISVSPGETPDHRVNEHIENDCKSDLANTKKKTYSNRCSMKGCKKRELVPVTCTMCWKNFCLRHRHEKSHNCIGPTASKSMPSNRAMTAPRRESSNPSLRQQPQKTVMSSIGRDLDRERELRRQNSGQSASIPSQRPLLQAREGGMSDDEALAFALQESLADVPRQEDDRHSNISNDVKEDLALARAIAQSEEDERNRQRQASQTRPNKDSGCNIT